MEKKILLIDDDDDELEIFTDALNKIPVPFTCVQSRNTEEATELLVDLKPDFVFIDFNMPRTNGLDTFKSLKQINGLESTRFIIYSNFISDEVRREAITHGAFACMKKPNMTSALTLRLREIIMPG